MSESLSPGALLDSLKRSAREAAKKRAAQDAQNLILLEQMLMSDMTKILGPEGAKKYVELTIACFGNGSRPDRNQIRQIVQGAAQQGIEIPQGMRFWLRE